MEIRNFNIKIPLMCVWVKIKNYFNFINKNCYFLNNKITDIRIEIIENRKYKFIINNNLITKYIQ